MTGILHHAHDQTTEEVYHAVALRLQAGLSAATDGAWTIRIHPGAELGSEQTTLRAVANRALDLATVTAANAAEAVPELGLFSAPYLFADAGHVARAFGDTVFRQAIDEAFARRAPDLCCLAMFTPGPRNLYARPGPIRSPADVAGLRLRVMASPVEARIWKSLGAITTAMPFAQIADAVRDGRVDAADDTAAVYLTQAHHKLLPWHSLTRHQWSPALLVANPQTLREMPRDGRDALRRTTHGLANEGIELAAEHDAAALQALKERTSAHLVEPDVNAFRDAFSGVPDIVAEELRMSAALERIRHTE